MPGSANPNTRIVEAYNRTPSGTKSPMLLIRSGRLDWASPNPNRDRSDPPRARQQESCQLKAPPGKISRSQTSEGVGVDFNVLTCYHSYTGGTGPRATEGRSVNTHPRKVKRDGWGYAISDVYRCRMVSERGQCWVIGTHCLEKNPPPFAPRYCGHHIAQALLEQVKRAELGVRA